MVFIPNNISIICLVFCRLWLANTPPAFINTDHYCGWRSNQRRRLRSAQSTSPLHPFPMSSSNRSSGISVDGSPCQRPAPKNYHSWRDDQSDWCRCIEPAGYYQQFTTLTPSTRITLGGFTLPHPGDYHPGSRSTDKRWVVSYRFLRS